MLIQIQYLTIHRQPIFDVENPTGYDGTSNAIRNDAEGTACADMVLTTSCAAITGMRARFDLSSCPHILMSSLKGPGLAYIIASQPVTCRLVSIINNTSQANELHFCQIKLIESQRCLRTVPASLGLMSSTRRANTPRQCSSSTAKEAGQRTSWTICLAPTRPTYWIGFQASNGSFSGHRDTHLSIARFGGTRCRSTRATSI